MAIRYYVSTEEASFFNNNSMGYANSIPTEGNYKVGDFIISSTQENGIFGWVCTVAGNPGEWEVIGSGMSDGSGMHDKIVGYVNAVSFSDARSSIEIGINEYKKGIDFLEVHYNGLMLAEGVHYNVSEDGKSIIAIDDVWNENADDTQQMIFRVLKSEGVNVKELKNTINIDSACYEVEMGIEGFNPEIDVVEVHLNGVLLVQGVDYEIVEGRISKLDRSEAWNPYNVNGQKMFVKVFRNNANLVEPEDGSVTVEKLAPELASDIAAIDGLVTTVDMQNNTISNLNDRVVAIEEKIESGDIVTNGSGGGPVKLTYKDNLVEVVNTNIVAIGLEFNKEKDMLEVHIDGLKLAEGVHYNISEDGLSIVKVDGVWNPDSLEDQYIDFRVITAGNEQIEHLTNNIEFSTPMTEVEIGLEYEHGVDILIVHLNGIKLVEGLDFEYVAEGNKIVKIDTSEPWNLYAVDGQLFVIDVLRNVGEKVTMDDLADDVKEAIDAAGNIDLSGKQDTTDNNLVTTDKTIVGAINELFQSANNGKELIADAIGEPLSSEDTFSAMSNDINSLLSTFKTNMMNNGIVVESGDKFKALIDKIATMVEEGEGKGVHFNLIEEQNDLVYEAPLATSFNDQTIQLTVNHNLGYTPNYIFFNISELKLTAYSSSEYIGANNIIVSNINVTTVSSKHYDDTSARNKTITLSITNINETSFDVSLTCSVPGSGQKYIGAKSPNYIAIGVGEEDTTLRDYLADILENKGVEVTEEEDMASLITKVDNLQSLNIITAQELPETVVDNQIVLITDTKPSAVNIKPTDLCGPTIDTVVDIGYNSSSRKAALTTNNNNITLSLYLYNAVQNKSGVNNTIYGFIGNNDEWNLFSPTLPDLYKEGGDTCDIMTGGWYTKAENDNGVSYTEKATVLDTGCLYMATYGSKFTYTNKPIDVTDYKKIYFDYHIESVSGAYWIGLVDNNTNMHDVQDAKKVIKQTSDVGDISRTTKSIDISDVTGEWYIAFDGYPWNGYQHRMYIYNIWMEM